MSLSSNHQGARQICVDVGADVDLSHMPIGDCTIANELCTAPGLNFFALQSTHRKPGAWLKSASTHTIDDFITKVSHRLRRTAVGSASRLVSLRCGPHIVPGRASSAARPALPAGARTHQAFREQAGSDGNERKDEQGDEGDQIRFHVWTPGLDACAASGAMQRAIFSRRAMSMFARIRYPADLRAGCSGDSGVERRWDGSPEWARWLPSSR